MQVRRTQYILCLVGVKERLANERSVFSTLEYLELSNH